MPASLSPLPDVERAEERARVLIVDDVPANLMALEAVLEPLGHDLVLANSGREALKLLLDEEFAVILMDVQMPHLDGLETARVIRERQRTRHIPIIFVTALSREAAYVMAGYAEGAVDYLLKPIEPAILRTKVQVFVELFLRGERLKRQALELAAQRRAQEDLRRATELEQQLVGIVGHDLRTPINAIQLTAQQQIQADPEDSGTRRAFERVARGADRINGIVDLLLDFTRERLGGGIIVTRAETDLVAAVTSVIEELRTTHPNRRVSIDVPEATLSGQWDRGRLEQVICNLAGNALKYSPPDSQVTIALAEVEGRAVLRVHNEGAPIPPEQLPSVFEPFRRGREDDEHATVSLGLGLFIASAIVRAHAGTITVRSEPGFGTEFRVSVPRYAPAAAAPAVSGAQLSA